jgi:hypothetical protein
MTFLDRLSKGIQKGAAQTKFEADKLMRQQKVGGEVTSLASSVERAVHGIGAKVVEMHKAGNLDVAVLQSMVAEVMGLEAQVAAKKAELEAIKVEQFVEPLAAAGPAPMGAPVAPVRAPEAAPAVSCPSCGSAVAPGAKFCPSCGQKM